MSNWLKKFYVKLIIANPTRTIFLVAVCTIIFGFLGQRIHLDASSESLILETDDALKFYRSIRARYGSDDFLVVTFSPYSDLFADDTLNKLRSLRDDLAKIERVESVISLLDVPLVKSPPVTLSDLQKELVTLDSPSADTYLARVEFVKSPVYRNLLISPDGKTTALQVVFQRDDRWHELLEARNKLLEQQLEFELTPSQARDLKSLSDQFNQHTASLQVQQSADIARVREILDQHREWGEIYLGGVPMIASDSIAFIQQDLRVFGITVLLIIVALLLLIFRQPRWILLPVLICGTVGTITVGVLGFASWPITVVSSNFVSLLLIFTLSLCIHLIVRYRELHAAGPDLPQKELVQQTVFSKASPCFYTAITTIVAFGSLTFSGIRTIMDFGMMMSVGVMIAFAVVFTLMPAVLMLIKPGKAANKNSLTDLITGKTASLVQHTGRGVFVTFCLVGTMSAVGMVFLTVENRFLDYFHSSTEIYKGMSLIDQELGGTTPLDVIIDMPPQEIVVDASDDDASDDDWEDSFEPLPNIDGASAGFASQSYWFNAYRIGQVYEIHDFLDGLPETGKVLSMTSAMRVLKSIDPDIDSANFELSLLYKVMPQDFKDLLFSPYLSSDGNQIRFAIRVFESDPGLQRSELLDKIRTSLVRDFDLEPDQVQLTGMLVLYNNMLQSLFQSQILTLSVVFLSIMVMFWISFRSVRLAALAIIPNILAAAFVLGVMGWLEIPLDLMTITIAAISVGIAVDDTIHYVHRWTDEYSETGDAWEAVRRSHASIGRAMYYTTITITLGFSVLVLSNFVPTAYFGILTGIAMLIALIADLTLLPLLLAWAYADRR